MKKQLVFIGALLLLASVGLAQSRAPNPFITHMFTADPSAHVWDDGRLYVYPSTDIAGSGYSAMDGYHVFSTDDMVNWTDHGEILHSDDVSWGRAEGGYMWAPDCAYKDGTYYFYYPHPSGSNYRTTWKIGVATSSSPTSGFVDQGYMEGLYTLYDPCVFTDDDGQSYFYQGGPNVAYGGKLKDNMMEIDGALVQQQGLDDFREGLWVFKRNGIYYAIYPDGTSGANQMRYAMSDNPLGPWEYQSVFLGSTDVITTHGSVVEYKGQWYVFYHNGALSGGVNTNRSICFDRLTFNADGTINRVEQTLGWSGSSNLAAGGTVAQSSTAYSGVASRAIDGSTSGNWGSGSITHTANEDQPWWQVDLGQEYDINEIVIWGRTDSCCQSRLSDYDVSILDSDMDPVWTNYQSGYPDPFVELAPNNATGQHVLVQLRGSATALSLAEVEVFGTPAATTPTERVVTIRKRNAEGYAFDGGSGGANGQNANLWSFNANSPNQQWIEIDRGNGYYSYQKAGTSFCLDGGNGGAKDQNVYLWTMNASNQNQHWQKVHVDGNYYRLVKRNAPDYCINGGSGGANGQNLALWTLANSQNLQWLIEDAP